MIWIIIFCIWIFIHINQLVNKDKRFQESNKVEQIWRYRYYLAIPFLWVWHTLKGFKVYEDKRVGDKIIHTEDSYLMQGKPLWRLLIGMQQGPMKWYYTSEEVFDKIKNKKR